MESNPSIKKNYMYSMAYQLLIMILPLITAPYLSRVVGAEGTGIYSYTYAIAQYFVYFAMLGISNYGNRSIAKVRDDKMLRDYTFSSIYQLQIFTSLLVIIVYLFYCFICVRENRNIALLQSFFVISAIFDISWLFFGMENFKVTVTRQILVKIGSAICIFMFIKSPADLWKYTLILSFGVLISQIYLFINVKTYVSFSFVSIKKSFFHLKSVLVLFIPIIATSIYRVMDKVMTGALSNMAEVGYYENADKLITTCLGVVGSLGAVMLPKMTNLVAKGDIKKQQEYLLKSIEVTMFIAFAISFGIYSVADMFVPFFYGTTFLPSITITKILSISVPFISWANVVRMQYLIPNEKDKIYVSSIVIGAISNVIINYALIPKFQANGAAIGTLCAEAIVMLVQTIASYKQIKVSKFIRKSIPFLVNGITMLCLIRAISCLMDNTVFAMLLKIGIGGLWYLSCSFVYFYYIKNEILFSALRVLKRVIRRK